MLVIHDVWPRYDAHQAARKTRKSWQNDRSILLRVMPRLPAVLADVRAVHVEDVLLEWAAAGKAPKTLNRAREVVHTFFAWLVRREELTRNPIDRVEKRAEPAPVITFLGTDEIAALLDLFAGSALLPVVSVLVFAGVRRSEACWLRVDDYDRGRELLSIRRKTIGNETWEPKTKRNRVVPVSARLAEVLHQVKPRNGWLLASPRGMRWDPDNLSTRFRRRVRAAGLPWRIADLRHTFGTHLVRRGLSLPKVAALMGNSPEIVRRHYAHVTTEDLHTDVAF